MLLAFSLILLFVTPCALQAFRFTPFKLLDITRLSLSRPDGHSGAAAGVPYKTLADCSHWCVPGVPDTWADILYSMILKKM